MREREREGGREREREKKKRREVRYNKGHQGLVSISEIHAEDSRSLSSRDSSRWLRNVTVLFLFHGPNCARGSALMPSKTVSVPVARYQIATFCSSTRKLVVSVGHCALCRDSGETRHGRILRIMTLLFVLATHR